MSRKIPIPPIDRRRPARGCPVDEPIHAVGVPVLSRHAPPCTTGQQREYGCHGRESHIPRISKRLRRATTIVAVGLLAGCEDLGGPADETLPTADLLILAQQSAAPAPTGQTFFVSNARPVTRNLLHPDAGNTLYLRIEFPMGSLDALGGTPLGPTDSVQVTVTPRSGAYGFTISPSGLVFATGALPRATMDYAVYGDRSVADGVPTYPDRDAYSAALDLWTEISPGQWRRAPNSTPIGVDAVEGRAEGAGNYLVAAPR